MYVYVRQAKHHPDGREGWYRVDEFTEDGGAWVESGKRWRWIHFSAVRIQSAY